MLFLSLSLLLPLLLSLLLSLAFFPDNIRQWKCILSSLEIILHFYRLLRHCKSHKFNLLYFQYFVNSY